MRNTPAHRALSRTIGTAAVAAVGALGGCSLLTDFSALSGGDAVGPTSDAGLLDRAAATDAMGGDARAADAGGAEAGGDGPSGSKYAAEVLADAPLTYLRLGEASGNVASDATGNGNVGTLGTGHTFGVPGAIVGDGDTAIHFDGVSSGINLGADPRFNFTGNHPYSLEAWVKVELIDTTYRHVFKKNALPPTGRESVGVYVQNGDVGYERIVTGLHATARTPATAFIGDWKHVVATYDGALLHLYVDGELRATDNDARASVLAGVPLFVACGDAFDDTVIKGALDEVAVYDKALSLERVLVHFQTGRGLR